ncbi:hypothetical protein NL676_001197 [Syzygium grande]|nr:hypothetical protein NL676_001197 [Syzygium grande]
MQPGPQSAKPDVFIELKCSGGATICGALFDQQNILRRRIRLIPATKRVTKFDYLFPFFRRRKFAVCWCSEMSWVDDDVML